MVLRTYRYALCVKLTQTFMSIVHTVSYRRLSIYSMHRYAMCILSNPEKNECQIKQSNLRSILLRKTFRTVGFAGRSQPNSSFMWPVCAVTSCHWLRQQSWPPFLTGARLYGHWPWIKIHNWINHFNYTIMPNCNLCSSLKQKSIVFFFLCWHKMSPKKLKRSIEVETKKQICGIAALKLASIDILQILKYNCSLFSLFLKFLFE